MSTTVAVARGRFATTTVKELVVAVSGLVLVLFILGHLSGNLLIFLGPEMFNAYAEHLQALGPLLWVARLGMVTAFVLHVGLTAYLKWSNLQARGGRYAVRSYMGRKTWATRLMIYTGAIIFLFLFMHLKNFTLGDQIGAASIVPGMNEGESLGLYGLVYNSFGNPLFALVYIVAVCCVGFHLTHAVSSIWVTLGVLTDKATTRAEWAAKALGALVAVAFSLIPVYVLVKTHLMG